MSHEYPIINEYTIAGAAWSARPDQGYQNRQEAKAFYTYCRHGFGVSAQEIRIVWCNALGVAREAWAEMCRRYPEKVAHATDIATRMHAASVVNPFWQDRT